MPLVPDSLQLDTMLDDIPFDESAFDPSWFNLDPDIYYDNQNNCCGFIPNANIVDEVDRNDFNHLSDTTTGTPFSNLMSFTGTGR